MTAHLEIPKNEGSVYAEKPTGASRRAACGFVASTGDALQLELLSDFLSLISVSAAPPKMAPWVKNGV